MLAIYSWLFCKKKTFGYILYSFWRVSTWSMKSASFQGEAIYSAGLRFLYYNAKSPGHITNDSLHESRWNLVRILQRGLRQFKRIENCKKNRLLTDGIPLRTPAQKKYFDEITGGQACMKEREERTPKARSCGNIAGSILLSVQWWSSLALIIKQSEYMAYLN